MMSPAPASPSFPYTTLFRSCFPQFRIARAVRVRAEHHPATAVEQALDDRRPGSQRGIIRLCLVAEPCGRIQDGRILELRSEEHTSELQSRGHLVCRLLLEKKKNQTSTQAKP